MAQKPDVNIVELAKSKILDEDANASTLGSLWAETPVILIFLRHFACVACRGHASQVWKQREMYESTGAELYFIGNGQPGMIKAFKEDLKIEGAKIYTDPTLKSFQAAGFKRGFIRALGPKSLVNGRKLMKDGHTQDKYEKAKGDLWQLGGILAVKPGGVVTYQFISEATGDFPLEEDLKAL